MNKCNIICVDLPETLCLSMVFIADLFPEAQILMPHEIGSNEFNHYDFVFLTPKQIDMIEDNSIDLAINTYSFQEMTHKQIEEYFQLIQRSCKNNSYFFTSNRVEKTPCGPEGCEKETSEPPVRFSEYPWNHGNEALIYEICRLMRLVQLDNVYIRLEKIKK
ncbi:TPA: putative sugar O-methyltransferase [Candidatus Woesearchaeota archaeon]|nr:putative sugar O-methyltransferase [Candidatus Woesearchaeota archaeon]